MLQLKLQNPSNKLILKSRTYLKYKKKQKFKKNLGKNPNYKKDRFKKIIKNIKI